jgi:hypothetical protein
MASQLVGLENLPNVYIKKITLEDNTSQVFTASVNLEILDKLQSGRFIWSSDETLGKFLRVCLISNTNTTLTQVLTRGVIEPLPSRVTSLDSFDSSTTSIHTFSIPQFRKDRALNTNYYRKTVSLQIPDEGNFTIFAFVFLDTVEVQNHWGIDLSQDLGKYFGAVSSEKILENGAIPRTTNLFVNPDNTLWTGPVHYHPQDGYMQGSVHSSEAHEKLSVLRVDNLKIIDNRNIEYESKQKVEQQQNAIISEAYYSMDAFDNLTGVFYLNIRELALSKTKYGAKILRFSQKMFDKYMQSISINSISVIRQQIKTRRGVNKLGSPSVEIMKVSNYEYIDNSLDTAVGVFANTDLLKEMHFNSDKSVRYFSFIDKTRNSGIKSEYKYKVEITFVDRSQNFMNSELQDISDNFTELKNVVNFLSSPSRYDSALKQLKPQVVMPEGIPQIIQKYFDGFSMIYDVEPTVLNQSISNKLYSMSLGNYSKNSGELFLKEYEDLLNVFNTNFKVVAKQGTSGRATNIKKSSMPNFISLSKNFSEIINFSDYRRSYDYLGSMTEGMSVLSRADFMQRSIGEVAKFFDGSKSYQSDDFAMLDASISSAVTDFTKSKSMYFTPNKFKYKDEKVDLSNLSRIDTSKLSKVFVKSNLEMRVEPKKPFRRAFKKKKKVGVPKLRTKKFKFPTRNRKVFTFKNVRNIIKVNELIEDVDVTIDSVEYLGDRSQFVNLKDAEASQEEKQILEEIEQVTETIDKIETTNVPRNKNLFDITTPNNVVDSFINSSKFSTEKMKKTPLAFKALVASRSAAARNNILDSDVDILKDKDTSPATEMVFQATQKIQMLAGFEKNKYGVSMFSKPIWMDMDPALLTEKSSVICKMTYVEMPEIGMQPSEDFKFAVTDQVFILSDSDIYNRKQSDSTETNEQTNQLTVNDDLSTKIIYATTNVVTQNPNKAMSNATSRPMTTNTSNSTAAVSVQSTGTAAPTPAASTFSGGYSSGGGGGGY